jgi:hypothetical protein
MRKAFCLQATPRARGAQQPRHIPLIRSFMMASSELMLSTYFELSVREAWTGREAGAAAADAGAGLLS